MRLSTRGRFAITAMIDLALRESGQPVPLQDIALRHRPVGLLGCQIRMQMRHVVPPLRQ